MNQIIISNLSNIMAVIIIYYNTTIYYYKTSLYELLIRKYEGNARRKKGKGGNVSIRIAHLLQKKKVKPLSGKSQRTTFTILVLKFVIKRNALRELQRRMAKFQEHD